MPADPRLPALDERRIAGLTVASSSARIGDGRSTYETGVISATTGPPASRARGWGSRVRDWVDEYRANGLLADTRRAAW